MLILYGHSNLTVSITSQVASITTPTDWNGNETITFTATDTGDGSDAAKSDSDNATFTVTAVNDVVTLTSAIADYTVLEDATATTVIDLDDVFDDIDIFIYEGFRLTQS